MPDKAISNTSPLLYLHRCSGLEWLSRLFILVCELPIRRFGAGPNAVNLSLLGVI
jgi:hypothetical protein